MKFIFSFFVALGMMFGFAPEAEAHTIKTTVIERVCSVEKQYVSGHFNRRGRWVSAHYRRVRVCRDVPRTVFRRTHYYHLPRHHHRPHRHRHGVRLTVRL
jgi:hypothetical protein